MKVLKVKLYEDTQEIVPLDPQPVKVNGQWNYDRSGTDEKGDYVVIDFITEESTYLEYNATGEVATSNLQVTTEEEWNKPAISDTEILKALELNSAQDVSLPTLPKCLITNTETNQQTSLTETESSTLTTKSRSLGVWDVIISKFQRLVMAMRAMWT